MDRLQVQNGQTWANLNVYLNLTCYTVELLNIRTPEKYTVIILKLDSYGFFVEKYVQLMYMERQTV